MTDRFSVIDPTKLGEMTVIEKSDANALLRRRMLSVKEKWTAYDPPYGAEYDVEDTSFDPIKVTQHVGTDYQILIEARVNQAARNTTLAFGYGRNLDAIASRYPGGVPRVALTNAPRAIEAFPQDWESDRRYQKRIWLSANAFSTAGSREAYEFWAMTAAPTLRDVSATAVRTPEGTIILITCLGGAPDMVPTADELLAVRRVMNRRDVRPLSDVVTVQPPRFVDVEYRASVYLFPGPDAVPIQTQLDDNLADYIEESRYLGKDHIQNDYTATLTLPGITHSVIPLSPAKSIEVNDTQVVRVVGQPIVRIEQKRKM